MNDLVKKLENASESLEKLGFSDAAQKLRLTVEAIGEYLPRSQWKKGFKDKSALGEAWDRLEKSLRAEAVKLKIPGLESVDDKAGWAALVSKYFPGKQLHFYAALDRSPYAKALWSGGAVVGSTAKKDKEGKFGVAVKGKDGVWKPVTAFRPAKIDLNDFKEDGQIYNMLKQHFGQFLLKFGKESLQMLHQIAQGKTQIHEKDKEKKDLIDKKTKRDEEIEKGKKNVREPEKPGMLG